MKTVKAYVASSERERLEAELRANVKPRAGEHTPGPWSIYKGDAGEMKFLVGSDGQGFAHTVGLGEPRDTANAMLIISAPQLLAERDQLRAREKELVSRIETVANSVDFVLEAMPAKMRPGLQAIVDELRAALSKVRGA